MAACGSVDPVGERAEREEMMGKQNAGGSLMATEEVHAMEAR